MRVFLTKLLFDCTYMLNSYETQRAEKANKDHHFAAKKNVSISVIQFWLTYSFVYVLLF